MTEESNVTNVENIASEEKPAPEKFIFQDLEWISFAEKQPDPDRWIIIYCPMGELHPNFFISFRDLTGCYQFPHPTKQYTVKAWAYIYPPSVLTP